MKNFDFENDRFLDEIERRSDEWCRQNDIQPMILGEIEKQKFMEKERRTVNNLIRQRNVELSKYNNREVRKETLEQAIIQKENDIEEHKDQEKLLQVLSIEAAKL